MQTPSEKKAEDSASDTLPLNIGAGAMLGGAAGAAMGTAMTGPIGGMTGSGLAAGALVGGLVGMDARRKIDPTEQDAYWREQHPSESYAVGEPYEIYEPAYRAGYEGYDRHSGQKFEDVEEDIREKYHSHKAGLPWEKARPAAHAAWARAESQEIKLQD